MDARISSTRVINYKLQGRRSSTITLQKPSTDEASEFTPNITMALTHYHRVRMFGNLTGDYLVVKSPIDNVERISFDSDEAFEQACWSKEKYITKEFMFLKQAYPDELPYHLETGLYDYNRGVEWSFRFVMPLIISQSLDECMKQIGDTKSLLTFILAIALELDRINKLGIIHGDVYYNNAFAKRNEKTDGYTVHFIDFDRAYSINDVSATVSSEDSLRWAPERCNSRPVRWPTPSTKQDVYSFGYMVTVLMNMNPKFRHTKDNFNSQFPALSGIMDAQRIDPAERPELDQIIAQINNEISTLQRFQDLEKIIQHYSLVFSKVKHGMFAGQLPRNIREINSELDKIKNHESSERQKQGLANIMKIAQRMGNQHPIFITAKKCSNLISTDSEHQLMTHRRPVG
jgi:hypothetical protein